jgi:tRNA(His) guanylyltransferase
MNRLNHLNITTLGNVCKYFEKNISIEKMIPLLPVIIRFDGSNFSGFTKNFKKPCDERLSNLMMDTTEYMFKLTNASIAYTQSDEITLVIYQNHINETPEISNIFGNGRKQKMLTELTSHLTVFFTENVKKYIPEVTKIPVFDCRVYQVPNLEWAVNQVYWRQLDGIRNSKLNLGRCFYSQNELSNLSPSRIKEKLYLEKNVLWSAENDHFKFGTFFVRKEIEKPYSIEELDKLPEKHNARKNPNLVYKRNIIIKESLHLGRIDNIDTFIFDNDQEMILSTFKIAENNQTDSF